VKSILVGVTGAFGSGKTTVTAFFEEWGCPVIRSDDVARTLMENDADIRTALMRDFGGGIFSHGTLDRKLLAATVFQNKDKLRLLNSIVHPKTIETVFALCERHISQGSRIVFVESALIYSAHIEEKFDFIIAVLAPVDCIFDRVRSQRGLSEDEIGKRLKSQTESEAQNKHADFIIRNAGAMEELKRNAQLILNLIKAYLT
jgi:dephospho-CoA kinase